LKSPGLVSLLSNAADPTGQFPVYDNSPLYLRESLVFPYSAGMQFQQAIVVELGKDAFRRVFDRPPASSREVLHPEVYLSTGREDVPVLIAPEIAPGKEWKLLVSGMMGEFDHRVLLKQYDPVEVALAAEWRGSDYRIWEHKKTKRTALTYVSVWSTPESAQRYLQAYRRVLMGKWTDCLFTTDSPGLLRGTGGAGAFEVRLDGARVISSEGLPGSTLKP
jgi:hypothetical protein